MEEDLKEHCNRLRNIIKRIAIEVKSLRDTDQWNNPNPEGSSVDVSEGKANIMLSYRHLEDAAMRLGKVIQAYDGGVSVYDKPQS